MSIVANALVLVCIEAAAVHLTPQKGGGGSGSVAPPYQISVLDAVTRHLAGTTVSVHFDNGTDTARAAEVAAAADAAIVGVASTSSEGSDRPTLEYEKDQSDYILAVGAAQKKSVVVAIAPGAMYGRGIGLCVCVCVCVYASICQSVVDICVCR